MAEGVRPSRSAASLNAWVSATVANTRRYSSLIIKLSLSENFYRKTSLTEVEFAKTLTFNLGATFAQMKGSP